MASKGMAVDPRTLNLPRGTDPDGKLPWVEAWDIVADEGVLVPAHAVFHPLPRGYLPLFRTNTNGLASGNTREEAVFHGLAEVVERDAWSLVEVTKRPGPRITDPPAGLPAELLGKFAGAKVEVTVRDITSDLGIPTCAAVSDDAVLRDPRLLTIGMGTHTSARIAFLRALTEVAQSRLTQIHGAREDTTNADLRTRMGYERVRRMNRYWFDADSELPFSALPSWETDDFLKDIGVIVSALGKAGMERVLVADLTRPELGVPVVRVVVPGLEVFAMDNERIGARCRDAERNRLSRPKP
jgi:ribosomal protein S12 methylthiotransferase accessory factor